MYLVFDIGGTNIRIASANDKKLLQSKITPVPGDFSQALTAFKTIADQLAGPDKVEAIAGGITGPLDKDKSMLVTSPNLPGLIKKPFKKGLEDLFSCPVYLENDSALGGLGEATFGAGKGNSIVCYIAVGTGIGGVRIVEEKIDSNSLGFEPGHQIIIPEGKPCNCGGRGHLESYVGGAYIERNYKRKAEDISDDQIWDEISRFLAIGLNNTIVHWSPDIVVLGGSVVKSIPVDKVNGYLRQFCTVFPQMPKVLTGTLGHEAGLYGALQYLKQQDVG